MSAVVVKTRKFKKNPLLARKQVCRRNWCFVFFFPRSSQATHHDRVASGRWHALLFCNFYERGSDLPFTFSIADGCGCPSPWSRQCCQEGTARSCRWHVQGRPQIDHPLWFQDKVWWWQVDWFLPNLRQSRFHDEV